MGNVKTKRKQINQCFCEENIIQQTTVHMKHYKTTKSSDKMKTL